MPFPRPHVSAIFWEQKRIVRCYLDRWPSQRAMKRLREKVSARTGTLRYPKAA